MATYIVKPHRTLLGPWFRLDIQDQNASDHFRVRTGSFAGIAGITFVFVVIFVQSSVIESIQDFSWIHSLFLVPYLWLLIWLVQRFTISHAQAGKIIVARARFWRPWDSYQITQRNGIKAFLTVPLRFSGEDLAVLHLHDVHIPITGDRKARQFSLGYGSDVLAQVTPLDSKVSFRRTIKVECYDERSPNLILGAILAIHLWR